jgi:DNA-binding GntR family transcriptional regulator
LKHSEEKSPTTQPLRPGNGTERVLKLLRDAIRDGQFSSGQRLIEADLMQTFNVTRGPLRESLRRLSSEGVVDIVPNRGAVVRSFSRQEMKDLFRIREVVEGLAARQAAEAMADAKTQKKFESSYQKLIGSRARSAASFSKENIVFHELVLSHARNSQLTDLMRQLQLPLIRFQIRASIDDSYRDASRLEHEAVGQAILEGAADKAERLMRQHLRQAARWVFQGIVTGHFRLS